MLAGCGFLIDETVDGLAARGVQAKPDLVQLHVRVAFFQNQQGELRQVVKLSGEVELLPALVPKPTGRWVCRPHRRVFVNQPLKFDLVQLPPVRRRSTSLARERTRVHLGTQSGLNGLIPVQPQVRHEPVEEALSRGRHAAGSYRTDGAISGYPLCAGDLQQAVKRLPDLGLYLLKLVGTELGQVTRGPLRVLVRMAGQYRSHHPRLECCSERLNPQLSGVVHLLEVLKILCCGLDLDRLLPHLKQFGYELLSGVLTLVELAGNGLSQSGTLSAEPGFRIQQQLAAVGVGFEVRDEGS